ncbi:sulfite exporter TauE/SafE family protein [bacterium]|nr:sulfite exporter TauE/SafE family protein [bacterium]
MILSWAIIGIIVGLLLGVTGAGGAIVAVPLFVYLDGVSVKDATVLSLVAVLSASGMNWFFQRKSADSKLAFILFSFSVLGSSLFRSVKQQSPEWLITGLFTTVGILSLASVWRKKTPVGSALKIQRPTKGPLLVKSALSGFGLGALVTMTGLGGGVVLLPVLKSVFDLSLTAATATSLLTIFLSSIFSLGLQGRVLASRAELTPVLALIVGSILSALLTQKIISKLGVQSLDRLRQVLLTVVIVISSLSLFLRH